MPIGTHLSLDCLSDYNKWTILLSSPELPKCLTVLLCELHWLPVCVWMDTVLNNSVNLSGCLSLALNDIQFLLKISTWNVFSLFIRFLPRSLVIAAICFNCSLLILLIVSILHIFSSVQTLFCICVSLFSVSNSVWKTYVIKVSCCMCVFGQKSKKKIFR